MPERGYREQLYHRYISRIENPEEEITLAAIENKFSIWDGHYRRLLPADRAQKIIEIGCGSGGFIHYLRSRGYLAVSGIDISEEQVAAAGKLGISGVTRGDFRDLLAESPGRYGTVVARDVLEHFRREEAIDILILIRQALAEGGVFLIQTVNAASPFSLRYRWGDLTHEMAFTADSLRSALRLAGFRRADFFDTPPVFRHSIASAVRSVIWKGVAAVWRLALLAESGDGRGILTGNLIAAAGK